MNHTLLADHPLVVPNMLQLCRDFSVTLREQQEERLPVILRTVECLDQYVDTIVSDADAMNFVYGVMSFLRFDDSRASLIPSEFMPELEALRDMLLVNGKLEPFCRQVLKTCQESRALRNISSVRDFVRTATSEGALGSELVLMGIDMTPEDRPEFAQYFRSGVGFLHLVRRYRHWQKDFADNRISLSPRSFARLQMKAQMGTQLISLVHGHPNKGGAFVKLIGEAFSQL